MGKKLDALLGRTFKVSKFKSLVNLAVSRLTVLKNHRQVKCSQAISDVTQLLQLGHHERALIRVEQVIKEQNMLDVFVMTEGYCNLLIERVHVIEQGRECPEELKEAISSLLFAASRIGEFPELNEIRASLTSRYGRELAARSIELRNNCGVNPKMIQKLSTKQPDMETRMKVLKEIAAENNIVLKLDEASTSVLEKTNSNASKHPDASAEEVLGNDYGPSDSIRSNKKYKNVADAAQAAFESAAYAAAAARAAVELYRADSHDHDNHDGPSDAHSKTPTDGSESKKPQTEFKQENTKSYAGEGSVHKGSKEETKRLVDDDLSSTSSEDVVWVDQIMSFREQDPVKLLEKETIIYDSEEETIKVQDKMDLIGNNNVAKSRLGYAEPSSVRTRQVRGY